MTHDVEQNPDDETVVRLIPMISYHRFANGKRYMLVSPGTYLVGATTWPIVDGTMVTLRRRKHSC
jgi:hypothetical protein